MTSNQGAGYSSAPQKRFDPMQGAGAGRTSTAVLQKKSESSPEEACKDLELKVHALLEESAAEAAKKDVGGAVAALAPFPCSTPGVSIWGSGGCR